MNDMNMPKGMHSLIMSQSLDIPILMASAFVVYLLIEFLDYEMSSS